MAKKKTFSILLINPKKIGNSYAFREESCSSLNDYPSIPAMLCQIAGILRKNGFDVEITDQNVLLSPISYKKYDVAISSAIFQHLSIDLKNLKEAKKNGLITIAIIHDSYLPKEVMGKYDFVDFLVREEREYVILKLIKSISKKNDRKKVKGIIFREGRQIIENQIQQPVPLDYLEFPAYDLLDLNRYYEAVVLAGKGCNYNCGFCYWANSKHRYKDINLLIKEIKYLSKYPFHHFYIYNLNFTTSRQFVVDFCKKLITQKIKIPWICDGRINEVDKDLLMLMKKAGCTSIIYGIESGSDFSLKEIRKGFTSAQAIEKLKLTKECGIIPFPCFIIGYPWEDIKKISQTEEFISKIIPKFAETFSLNFLAPIPGSRLHQELIKEGLADKIGLVSLEKARLGSQIESWGNEPFARTKYLSKEDLKKIRKRILKRAFYKKILNSENIKRFMSYPIKKKVEIIKNLLKE